MDTNTMSISIHDAVTAKRENGQRGFTLIELLVVVIIIGVLAAIAIPVFLGQQGQARLAAVESALTNAKTEYVAALVSSPDGTVLPARVTTLEQSYSQDGVTITLATVTTTAFCFNGSHSGNTAAADKRHVRDTGGVRDGTCASPIDPPTS